MGYLFLAVSLFAGATKGFCGKTISNDVKTLKGTSYINLLRMTLCIVIGFFVVAAENIRGLNVDMTSLLIALLSGLSTALFVLSWIFSVRNGAYVMLDVFLMLGVGVTLALCKIFFNDSIALKQYIGLAMLLVAACILCSYSSTIKSRFTVKSFALLIGCGIANGLTDFSQKTYVHLTPDGSVGVFNFYTYIFAALTLLLFFLVSGKIENAPNDGKTKKAMLAVAIMSVCLFANSYFKTLAAEFIAPAILYPLSTGAALILSVLMSVLFFKEKATPKCIIGVVLAFAALIIMNC
jgi:drug/metabolite transporter (DMT)-like permease